MTLVLGLARPEGVEGPGAAASHAAQGCADERQRSPEPTPGALLAQVTSLTKWLLPAVAASCMRAPCRHCALMCALLSMQRAWGPARSAPAVQVWCPRLVSIACCLLAALLILLMLLLLLLPPPPRRRAATIAAAPAAVIAAPAVTSPPAPPDDLSVEQVRRCEAPPAGRRVRHPGGPNTPAQQQLQLHPWGTACRPACKPAAACVCVPVCACLCVRASPSWSTSSANAAAPAPRPAMHTACCCVSAHTAAFLSMPPAAFARCWPGGFRCSFVR